MRDRLLAFGPFVLDRGRARVLRDGVEVALQPKAFDLLWFLAERRGTYATRDEIHAAVWPGVHVGLEALPQMIHRIRRALGDARPPRWIEVVSRRGYRMLAEVREVVASEDDSLIGRAGMLADLMVGVQHPGLTLLLGNGGIGKTTLARRLIELRSTPSDAWMDLTDVADDPGLVLATAGALGLGAAPSIDDLAARAGRALQARGPSVVVLDNLEQIAVAAAGRLAEWRKAAPEVHFVGTSRVDLQIPGRRIELPPLEPDDAVVLFERTSRHPVPIDERAPLRDLVESLGRNPLAVELAAARFPVLRPSDILGRLAVGTAVLRRGTGRHDDMGQVVQWSWRLLDAAEQRVLLACALWGDRFETSDVEATAGSAALDPLQELIRHRLVEVRERPPRLGLAQAVRVFARERLADHPDQATLERAHLVHLLGAAEASVDRWRSDPTAANLSASVAFAAGLASAADRCRSHSPDLSARAAIAAGTALVETGPMDIAYDLLDRHADGAQPDSIGALATLLLRAASYADRIPQALLTARRVLVRASPGSARLAAEAWAAAVEARAGGPRANAVIELERISRDPAADLFARRTTGVLLGEALARSGHLDRAEPLLRETLATCQTPDSMPDRRTSLLYLANIAKAAGRFDEALVLYDELLDLCRRMGGRSEHANEVNVANLHSERGDPETAERLYRSCLENSRAKHDTAQEAVVLGNLATCQAFQGRYAEASEGFRQTLARADAAGDRTRRAWVLFNLGTLARYQGRPWEALTALQESLELARRNDHARFMALARIELAATLADSGRVEEARGLLSEEAPTDPVERALTAVAQGHVALAERLPIAVVREHLAEAAQAAPGRVLLSARELERRIASATS